MATIRDVAREAGVSVATVSAYLTGNRFVSTELADRVMRAITNTSYRKNSLASGLKSGKTKLVGLVVPDITNPFFTDFVDLIETLANAAGYSIILRISKNNAARELAILDLLWSNRVDGTIICPAGSPETARLRIASHEGALIAFDNADPTAPYDSVTVDNRKMGLMAAQHLLGLGHVRLGIITGPGERVNALERKKGFLEGIGGETAGRTLVVDGNFTAEGGFVACQEMLLSERRPTAIFVSNNQMLIGVMRALSAARVEVPQSISVVSVDDFPWADSFRPSLTTIRQPLVKMAEECWKLFESRLKTPEAATQATVLEAELIIRGSTTRLCGNAHIAAVSTHLRF